MSVGEFTFLVGAMLDCTDPDQTDPAQEVATRRMREIVLQNRAMR